MMQPAILLHGRYKKNMRVPHRYP